MGGVVCRSIPISGGALGDVSDVSDLQKERNDGHEKALENHLNVLGEKLSTARQLGRSLILAGALIIVGRHAGAWSPRRLSAMRFPYWRHSSAAIRATGKPVGWRDWAATAAAT
jgi:hypothetical protein